MDNEYLEKLHSWGLEWGLGDSRNPEEIRDGKGGQHTNQVVAWLKYQNQWYTYTRCGILRMLDSFTDCETQEELDIIIHLMISDGLLDNGRLD
jgi:hypothetical protein